MLENAKNPIFWISKFQRIFLILIFFDAKFFRDDESNR